MQADANLAAGHELWGYLLAARGDLNGAARELQAAVRLEPDFWRAQYELGAVLQQRGNAAGALQHLRLAAQGQDAQAKAAAQQLLQRLGY